MSRMTWDAVLQRAMGMPEGRHLRVRCGASTLLLERRGDVLIALRELSRDDAHATALTTRPANASDCADFQILAVGDVRYLCHWRRLPTQARWLATLAGGRS